MDYVRLGKRIREERLKLNLTQEKLAESVNLSDSYIGQIERGERSLTLDTLIRLANNLGVTIDYLLKDSIEVVDDNYINQLRQLINGRQEKEKIFVLDMIKMLLNHIDEM